MSEKSRTTLETKIDANGSDVELDIRFPITKVELKRGFWRGTMWIIRPKRGRARVFSSEKEAMEYAARIFGKR